MLKVVWLPMILLGIDYGRSRTGLALAVESIVETKGYLGMDKEDIFKVIKNICLEEKIDRIVVGMSSGVMGEEIKQFAKKLFQVVQLPIIFVDESLTSWEAEKMVGWEDKGRVDSVSAALILERYLETK